MSHERPSIVTREHIEALLKDVAQSDLDADTVQPSDVHKKDNILPVEWSTGEAIRYETPKVVRRDSIAGLADAAAPSDGNPKNDFESDVNVKANIVPVHW